MDPVIPADILTVLLICLPLAVGWLALRHMLASNKRHRALRHRMAEPEPETYGDDGGRPSAHEFYAKRRAGE